MRENVVNVRRQDLYTYGLWRDVAHLFGFFCHAARGVIDDWLYDLLHNVYLDIIACRRNCQSAKNSWQQITAKLREVENRPRRNSPFVENPMEGRYTLRILDGEILKSRSDDFIKKKAGIRRPVNIRSNREDHAKAADSYATSLS